MIETPFKEAVAKYWRVRVYQTKCPAIPKEDLNLGVIAHTAPEALNKALEHMKKRGCPDAKVVSINYEGPVDG